ncbi:MAG: 2-amino-4-hydroxy-6-hydroxymethyldihydropteridine diphosphokinase [Parvularculaceae bacterium]|nr:2-amino-4-hydroxy-6-hydroxymethyldihydropteridine diphosphokinase [Parvularculaceae bacterium]
MILIGLGSSLALCGRLPQDVIRLAAGALDAHFGVAAASGLYASPAWPDPKDPPFVNAALALAAAPDPEVLLARLHVIEAAFGRRRSRKNAPRTLDLDLLAYGDVTMEGPVSLPHPGLFSRDFVLAPLAEIAPEFRPPRSDRTIRDLLVDLGAISAVPVSG